MYQQCKKAGFLPGSVFALFLIVTLSGCATGNSVEQDAPKQVQAPPPAPLERGYSDIYVTEIQANPDLRRDYGEAISECRSALISSLLMKNKYRRVEPGKGSDTYKGSSPLLVKLNLVDMRIASFGARFWGGVFAGNSFINMHMTLVDAKTNRALREEDFNSANNVWAAAWNLGASDRSLPSDMGKIMADYIEMVVPAK